MRLIWAICLASGRTIVWSQDACLPVKRPFLHLKVCWKKQELFLKNSHKFQLLDYFTVDSAYKQKSSMVLIIPLLDYQDPINKN